MQGILGKLDVSQNHYAVDDDAFGNRLITEKLDIATGVIGAIARHIDGMSFGFERRSGDLGGREVDGGTDGSAIEERSRGFDDQISEAGRSSRAIEDAPIDYELLLEGAGPIDEADRNLLVGTGFDGVEHPGIGYRRRIALTLELELRLIHAARHIHGQYEKQVDLLGSVGEWELSQGQCHQRQYASNDPAHGCVPEVICSSRGCDEKGRATN